jgi:hypothetical protein
VAIEPAQAAHLEGQVSTRRLGNSDLNISPVGFGAWAIGGTGYDSAWGKQDDADRSGPAQTPSPIIVPVPPGCHAHSNHRIERRLRVDEI